MPYEQSIALLDEETVLAECGPMRLVIRAWKDDRPQPELVRQAADVSFGYLEAVAKHKTVLSDFTGNIKNLPDNDLAQRMIESVRAIGDPDLTPMAAVAGTIADFVADWLFGRGLTKVVVDNGGDVSIRLAANETVAVGIRPKITSHDISHVVNLNGHKPAWGVTTSGLGGRSFTRGIASAVTVIAENASIADAAATSIANACFVEDSSIVQIPAEQMDPNTDLAGVKVTVGVESLSPGKRAQAVQTALSKADTFCRQKLIVGALIALEDVFAMTQSVEEFISPSN
ncbi:MAG: UPF0280 family protein [Planctomycetota bacterium]|jgi:ApbE superfamily uncharacterized protein (UPF0280 family)